MSDEKRAQELGMTLDEFQMLVGHDPLDKFPEFTGGAHMCPKDKAKKPSKKGYDEEKPEAKK